MVEDANIVLECVKCYVNNKYKYNYIETYDGNKKIHIFQAVRRKKLIIVSTHKMPSVELRNLFPIIDSMLSANNDYSETIEAFYIADVSLSTKESLREYANSNYGINVVIHDIDTLKREDEFATLFTDDQEGVGELDYTHSALYDYMTMSSETNEIKDSFYNSILLFQIYKYEPIAVHKLANEMSKIYGRDENSIKKEIDLLRRKKKVQTTLNGEIALNNDEKLKLRDALKTAKEEEELFMDEFMKCLAEYGIETEAGKVLELLIKLFEDSYSFNDNNHVEYGQIRCGNQLAEVLQPMLAKDSKQKVNSLIDSIHNLCDRNDYLKKITANTSFINMYKSNKYEDYVNSRSNRIFMDTPVFCYYLCVKSGFQEEMGDDWEDPGYQATKHLIKMVEDNPLRMKLCVCSDYIGETTGEFIKAIKLSWFCDSIDFEVHTGNTIYNYYSYIKKRMEAKQGKDTFPFKDFMRLLALPDRLDLDDVYFVREINKNLQNIIKPLGVEVTVNGTYKEFQQVKEEYKTDAMKKTNNAIENDIRQAFFISDSYKSGNYDCYLASWDKTLFKLRDYVVNITNDHRRYVIGSPSRIVNRLSLKYFRIKESYVTKEMFAFANKEYNLNDRISKLFDNVLVPLFSVALKKNITLVRQLLLLQKSEMDRDNIEDHIEQFRLEKLFNNLEDQLPAISCSWQNLQDFLSDVNNNGFIYNIIKEAYTQKRDCVTPEQIKIFCSMMKSFVDKQDADEAKL